ncbi:MAG: phosphate ABC transporter permease subunit PstC, partial [Gammaproteobacteria bacterium]|nr:phosphate ABC transporter permease subunit PstC [Gammaproteobacteria bacterium]
MFPLNKDKLLLVILRFLAGISVLSLLFILFYLLKEAFPILQSTSSVKFFTDQSWHPTSGDFLLLPMIIGSILIMLGAMLLSIPVGILTATLSQFYAPAWF